MVPSALNVTVAAQAPAVVFSNKYSDEHHILPTLMQLTQPYESVSFIVGDTSASILVVGDPGFTV